MCAGLIKLSRVTVVCSGTDPRLVAVNSGATTRVTCDGRGMDENERMCRVEVNGASLELTKERRTSTAGAGEAVVPPRDLAVKPGTRGEA